MRAASDVRGRLLALALAIGSALACATPGATTGRAREPERAAMDQARMELIFAEQVDAIEGPSGALRTIEDGVEVFLVTDPENDRMRLLSRIATVAQLDPRIVNVLLQANFYLTLDARYAVSDGIVFGVYVHPISSLTREELISALDQVISLAKNFGTTFSGGPIELEMPGEDLR